MKALKFILLLAITTVSFGINAAFICTKEMDCGQAPAPKPPVPRENKYLIMSTVEIKSPDCSPEDLQAAIAQGKIKNLEKAEDSLGTDIEIITDFRITRGCNTSVYDNSGVLYWVVHVFADYKKLTP